MRWICPIGEEPDVSKLLDAVARLAANHLPQTEADVVSICHNTLPDLFPRSSVDDEMRTSSMETTLSVALKSIPLPDETNSLEDVLNFKDGALASGTESESRTKAAFLWNSACWIDQR